MSITRASGVLLLLLAAACLRELRVEGGREQWSGVLYRVTFPSQCPGVPLTEDVHSGE